MPENESINSKKESMFYDIGNFFLRALVFSPLAASLTGIPVALIAFGVSGYPLDLGFALMYAMVYGAPIGLILGLLSMWQLRKVVLFEITKYLVGGTLLFALPAAFIPEIGVTLALLSGTAGFWVGYVMLRLHDRKKQEKASVIEAR